MAQFNPLGYEPQTQADIVRIKDMEEGEGPDVPIVENIRIPGLETAHERTKEELALVLANVLKSRPFICEFTFKVGSPTLEIKYYRR